MKIERYVLIIDDDQDFVHLTSVYLKRSGYRTSVQPLAALSSETSVQRN